MRSSTLFDAAHSRTTPIHIWRSQSDTDRIEFPAAWAQVGAAQRQFQLLGVQAGGVVALALSASPAFVVAVLAAWACRATVAILTPDLIDGGMPTGRNHTAEVLDLLAPHLIVHEADSIGSTVLIRGVPRLHRRELAGIALHVLDDVDCTARNFLTSDQWAPAPDDLAVIQLTSGSTGSPKGVPITHRMLAANCHAICERAHIGAADHMVSWLPPNHDMGLSALTVGLWADCVLTLMPSAVFSKAPTAWIEALSCQRGTISPAPVFAYGLIARFERRLRQLGVDLTQWRYAWAGAEPVFEAHLRAFQAALKPYGLRDGVVQPAYGMAEAVVAVTGIETGRPLHVVHADARTFRAAGVVKRVAPGPDALALVSNGRPLSNLKVKVLGANGKPVAEGVQGEILIAGATVASAYLNGVGDTAFEGGWFRTGDLGFLLDGEVYVTGRRKDLIIRGGVNVGAQEVERVVAQVLGIRPDHVAAFAHLNHTVGREELVAVVGKRPAQSAHVSLQQRLAVEVSAALGVQIDQLVFAQSADLLKTTSGKLRRSAIRERWMAGLLNETQDDEQLDRNESIV